MPENDRQETWKHRLYSFVGERSDQTYCLKTAVDVEGDPPAGELVLVAQPLHDLLVHHVRVALALAEREHGLVPYLGGRVVCTGEVEED